MSLPSSSIRIVRQRLFFEHPSPTERIVTSEYTLVNESDSDVKDIFLLDLPLMLGLEVFDEKGKSLPFLPNREVQSRCAPLLQNQSSPNFQLASRILQPGEPYFLWITLTENERIRVGEHKIIKLRYRDRKEASGIPSIRARIFTIKRYKIQIQKNPEQDYDLFVNISAPSGFEVKHNSCATEGKNILSESRGFYKSTLRDYVQLRIPTSDEPITADIEYDILPAPLEKRFISVTLVGLYIVAGIVLSLTVLQINMNIENIPNTLEYSTLSEMLRTHLIHSSQSILKKTFEISVGIIAASAAIAGLVRDPLIARVRLLYLGSAAIATTAFLIHG